MRSSHDHLYIITIVGQSLVNRLPFIVELDGRADTQSGMPVNRFTGIQFLQGVSVDCAVEK